jgi:hypothetical protein
MTQNHITEVYDYFRDSLKTMNPHKEPLSRSQLAFIFGEISKATGEPVESICHKIYHSEVMREYHEELDKLAFEEY